MLRMLAAPRPPTVVYDTILDLYTPDDVIYQGFVNSALLNILNPRHRLEGTSGYIKPIGILFINFQGVVTDHSAFAIYCIFQQL